MATPMAEFFEKWSADQVRMKEMAPAAMKGMGSVFKATMEAGALTVREKELIALAIGVTERCLPCIALHVEKCLKAGANREEIIEAASVPVMMRGGPAFTHIPIVLDALDHLEGKG